VLENTLTRPVRPVASDVIHNKFQCQQPFGLLSYYFDFPNLRIYWRNASDMLHENPLWPF